MIIDGHQHVFSNILEQKKISESAGLHRIVLFPTLVHPETAATADEFMNEMRTLNKILSGEINPVEARIRSIEELKAAIETNPDYFTGFGSVPTGLDLKSTGEWIETHIVGNSFKGIGEIAPGSGSIASLENIFRVVHESGRNLPLWIHTFNPLTLNDIGEIITLAAKYHTVKVILGHAGGSNWTSLIDLIRDHPNILVDTSASFTVFSIRYLAETFPERTLFSSDLPYGDPELGIRTVNHAVKDPHIRRRVLGLNTQELLGL